MQAVEGGAAREGGHPRTPVPTGSLAPDVTAANILPAPLLSKPGSRSPSGTSWPSEGVSPVPCFWTELRLAGRVDVSASGQEQDSLCAGARVTTADASPRAGLSALGIAGRQPDRSPAQTHGRLKADLFSFVMTR